MTKNSAISVAILLTSWAGLADAQGVSCPAYDLPCLSRLYELACRVEEATRTSCLDWTRELGASRLAEAPNARLTAATAYVALSQMTEGSEESAQFREQALEIYGELVAEDPSNVEALVGLAGIVDAQEERVELLNRIVEIDPTYVSAWEWLAIVVGSSDEPEDRISAAQYLEQAYAAATGNKKWHIAADVVLNYERAGSPSQTSTFVAKVRSDFGLEQKVERLGELSRLSQGLREETLREVCSQSAIIIFGATACFEGINSIVTFVNDAPTTSFSISAAEDAAEAMVLAANVGWRIATEYSGWHDALLSSMTQLADSDKATAPVYVAQARLLATDKLRRVEAMLNAARFAPNDGEIAFGLALAYFDLERWSEAAEWLDRARTLLPEARHAVVDDFLGRATDALSEEAAQ